MTLIRYISLTFISCIMLISCTIRTSIGPDSADQLEISWELNPNNENDQSTAIFSIRNTDKHKVLKSNWILFYNQAPRHLLENKNTLLAKVKHINGDYYKLCPTKGFKIYPNQGQLLSYSFSGHMIKSTDAPRGVFMAFYDKKGKVTGLSKIKNYQIKPIEYLRKNSEGEFLEPSPEWQYQQNKQLSVLPLEDLKPIIPTPLKTEISNKSLIINKKIKISSDKKLKKEADYLTKIIEKLNYLDLATVAESDVLPIHLKLKKDIGFDNPEAYSLSVKSDGIFIYSAGESGIFYGVQSLVSLLQNSSENSVPSLTYQNIKDTPRFSYRGLHLDVCRNFQTKQQVMKVLDLMAIYKLNTLHFYLTEDEAWRLEINSLPELTELGSKRGFTEDENDMLNPAYGSGPFAHKDSSFGTGFYTQQDFIEIIQHAHQRHIQVIPSINLPGHARAAIKAMEARYRSYSDQNLTEKALEFRLISPNDSSKYLSAQYYNDNIVDVSLESVYHFYETVIDEVIQIYSDAKVPLQMIHTGGDEVPEGVWTESASCKELTKTLGITDPKNLQSYFLSRIVMLLNNKGLKTGGWEEIALRKSADGNYHVNPDYANKSVIPYVWNNLSGSEDLGNKLANAGYPVVLCNATNFYFDLAYNNHPGEPGLYWAGYTNEYDPWNAMPYYTDYEAENYKNLVHLKENNRQNILGLQAQLWSETIEGPELLEYQLLPKLISFAERAWAPQPEWESPDAIHNIEAIKEKEWNDFINTVSQKELPRLNQLHSDITYRVAPPGAQIKEGVLYANTQYPGNRIFYSTDGSDPTEKDLLYLKPIEVNGFARLRCIDISGKMSRVLELKE